MHDDENLKGKLVPGMFATIDYVKSWYREDKFGVPSKIRDMLIKGYL